LVIWKNFFAGTMPGQTEIIVKN